MGSSIHKNCKWCPPEKEINPETHAVTVKLYKKEEHQNEIDGAGAGSEDQDRPQPEPSVLWTASVYNADTLYFNGRDKPYAIYQSSAPIDIHAGKKVERGSTTDENAPGSGSDPSTESRPRPTWTGCVFEVSRKAVTRHTKERPETDSPVTLEYTVFQSIYPTSVIIKSPFLYRVLKSLAGYYPRVFDDPAIANGYDITATHASEATSPLTFYEPWGFLLHRFLELAALAETRKPQDLEDAEDIPSWEQDVKRLEKGHAHHMVEFLSPYYDMHVVPCLEDMKQPNPKLPCRMLWYVFAPGTDVYIQTGTNARAAVVISVDCNMPKRLEEKKPDEVQVLLDLWYLDSNGIRIRRNAARQVISHYTGTKALTTLDVCPVAVWDAFDKGERRRKILEQNRLVFESLHKGHLLVHYHGPIDGSTKHYSGSVVIDHKRGLANSTVDFDQIQPPVPVKDNSTRFIEYDNIVVNTADLAEDEAVPAKSGRRSGRSSTSSNSSPDQRLPNASTVTTSLSEHQLLLLGPVIRGFALKTKQWGNYLTDAMIVKLDPYGIREVVQSDEGIKNLVVGEPELETIKGLSRRQNSKRATWAADFIEGKGTGQIILLHGPPGVGKTYTVEAVAQYLHRPLLALTIADIGTVETKVEQELIKWFTLAEAWNAVLLVDEADIFLERRQNRDLARNGLVSAFLRRMEYFKGLLFLTTNRVGQIDDAFISRVHVAIGYNALSPEDRSKIWEGFFRKLAKERAGQIQISPAAKKWVLGKAVSGEAQLNGRDIRNALQTAITLAEAECEEDPDFDAEAMTIIVDQSHFQRVMEITNMFASLFTRIDS
ncbi:hypothetical protein PG997_010370, partial [Apiospora hydei]